MFQDKIKTKSKKTKKKIIDIVKKYRSTHLVS
jgi:hypothetical protein